MRARALSSALILSLVATLALGVTAAPASGATEWDTTMSTGYVPVTLDGVRYNFALFARDTYVSATLMKAKNPDGALKATRRVNWQVGDMRDIIDTGARLSSAGIDTGGQMRPHGSIDATFDPNEALQESCNGHERRREGVLKGVVRLDTKTSLGVIGLDRMPVTVTASDGLCERTYTSPCHSQDVVGTEEPRGDGFNVTWMRETGSDVAEITASDFRDLNLDQDWVYGSMYREVEAEVPKSFMDFDSELRDSSIHGDSRIGITKTARFDGNSTTGRFAYRCGRNADNLEEYGRYRGGRIAGSMVVEFLVGPNRSLADGGMGGSASRSRVRSAE